MVFLGGVLSQMSSFSQTSDRIVEIIRRDLKLDSQIALDADTVLFGGELDLDSLDALLLVQSIEKEFSIKIPTEAMGPDIFQTLRTLTDFVNLQSVNQASA